MESTLRGFRDSFSWKITRNTKEAVKSQYPERTTIEDGRTAAVEQMKRMHLDRPGSLRRGV